MLSLIVTAGVLLAGTAGANQRIEKPVIPEVAGLFSVEVAGGLGYGSASDMRDIYGPFLSAEGVSYIWSYGGGVFHAVSEHVEAGLYYDRPGKKNKVIYLTGYETWRLNAQRISLRLRVRVYAGRSTHVTWPFIGRLGKMYVGGSIGRINLTGASLRDSFGQGDLNLSGTGVTGAVQVTTQIELGGPWSFVDVIGYEFGKVGPVRGTGVISGVPFDNVRLPNWIGEDVYVNYSGFAVNLGLKYSFQ